VNEQNKKKLLASEELIRESQEIAGLGSYILDIATGTWESSEVLDRLFGIDREYERSVEGWAALIHPDERAVMAAYFETEVLGKKCDFNREYRILRNNDKAVRWVFGIGRLKLDARGRPAEMHGVILDITERKQIETELRRSEANLNRAQAVAQIGSWILDIPSSRLEWSAEAYCMFGIPPQQAVAQADFAAVVHPDDRDAVFEAWGETVKNNTPFDIEHRIVVDGQIRWVRECAEVERDAADRPLAGVGTVQDITERKATEQALNASHRLFSTLAEISPVGIYRTDLQGNGLYNNRRCQEIAGLSMEQGLGTGWFQAVHPDDREKVGQAWSAAMRAGKNFKFEYRLLRQDGTTRWVLGETAAERDAAGSVVGYVGTLTDITERKLAENALRASEARWRLMLENDLVGIVTSKDRIIQWANPAYEKLLGYEKGEMNGVSSRVIFSSDEAYQNLAKEAYPVINAGGIFRTELVYRRRDGRHITVDVSGGLLPETGEALWACVDISERKKIESDLSFIAHYDMLTGIPNRALLSDRMKQAIAQTVRDKNMMAVCYLDLDGFKPINDTFGHEAGDAVLVEIARRIGNTVRGGDTVARMGGDEFAVVLLGLERGEECVATLERLLAAIAWPIAVKDSACAVSASIGVSIYPLDDEDPDTLLRHADQAMYVAKQAGRNRFHIYDPALDRVIHDQHESLKGIRHALEHGQFEMYYQPKVNLKTRELVGAEALIRWRHPERGLLAPGEFLHYTENTDLDIAIGVWVTKTVLAQMQQWQNAGLDIEVSINISGFHLESAGFVETLAQQLARYPDLPRGRLQIEVLETVALDDIATVRDIIESCREIGVGFALDDFGTGYSSLSYLSRLPIDALKIDQSFVRDMLEDRGDMAIVQGIIALARAFDRQTVAEGIETEDHYRILLDMGCELGQGYGIARPMPASQMENWKPDTLKQL
jgi:diguanylate cyclase (GGDEF)-like protein/PAS domain S-box-containing protein